MQKKLIYWLAGRAKSQMQHCPFLKVWGLYQEYIHTVYRPIKSDPHSFELLSGKVPSKKDVPALLCSRAVSRCFHTCSWGLIQEQALTHMAFNTREKWWWVFLSVSADNFSSLLVACKRNYKLLSKRRITLFMTFLLWKAHPLTFPFPPLHVTGK